MDEGTEKNVDEKFFVGRENYKIKFRESAAQIPTNSSSLIFYSGAGGVGKTSLIRELENTIDSTSLNFVCKYARYDFNEEKSDMLTVLNALKKILSDKYGISFPMYEKCCIYYLQKRGDLVSSEHLQNLFNQSSVLKKALGHVDNTLSTVYKANTFTNVIRMVVNGSLGIFDKLYETSTVLRFLQMGIRELDKHITKRAQQVREENDLEYGKIIRELETRNSLSQADSLKEYLPTLFARDISDWLKENNSKLVIFLDTYEIITGDEKDIKPHERLISINKDVPVDWWIEELLTNTTRILWVIAGRSAIPKIGIKKTLKKDETLFPLNAFDNNVADEFLIKAGIENAELRNGIIELTGGYPNYLSACVDTYREIISAGGEPNISDFGEQREVIVSRLISFMNSSARQMVKRLCILGTWTDDIAKRILIILHEYNAETYSRIKKLSFIFTRNGVINFDRSLQKILFAHLKETDDYLIEDTRRAVNEFFRNVFYKVDDDKTFANNNPEQIFRFWCEIILRTTDNPKTLMIQYAKNLSPLSQLLNDSDLEDVIKKFQDKNFTSDKIPFAYFEHLMAQIKLRQGKDKTALTLAESAYNDFKNIHGVEKISVINTLADVYEKLKRTGAEIELRRESLVESKKYYYSDTAEEVIQAQRNLAHALERGDKKNAARKIYNDILHALKDFGDDRKVETAVDYVRSLEQGNKLACALMLRKRIVEYYRNINDEVRLIEEIKNLVWALRNFSSEESLYDKLQLQRELVEHYKKTCGEYSNEVVEAMYNVFDTLQSLNRVNEFVRERENLVEKFKSRLEETPDLEEKVELMKNLMSIATDMHKDYDAAQWKAKVKQTLLKIIEEKTTEPIEDYEGAISLINDFINELNWETNYREVVDWQRKILELTEQNPNSTEDEIIISMKYFAYTLAENAEGYDEALSLREKVLERTKARYSDKTHPKILSAMNDIAALMEKFTDNAHLALGKRQEILNYLIENKADDRNIFLQMKKIAALWTYPIENYNETLKWRQRILKFSQENFPSNAPEIVVAMEELASAYENLDEYDNAASIRAEVLNIKAEQHGGKSGLDFIETKIVIADRLHKSGKYDEELKIRNEIVELYRQNYDDNSGSREEITNALNIVTELLNQLGRVNEAYDGRKKIVDELKAEYEEIVKEVGENSEDAVMKLESIADALDEVGDYEDELRYRKKIVEVRKASDEKSVETVYAMGKLAEMFAAQDNEEEEFKIRNEIAQISRKVLEKSTDENDIVLALHRIILAENDLNHYDEVEYFKEQLLQTRRDIVEKREKYFGESDTRTITALEELAGDLRAYNRNDEELNLRREILERLKKNFIEENILSTLKDIAYALNCLKDYEGVLKLRQDIMKKYRPKGNAVENISTVTLDAMNELAVAFEHLSDYRAVLEIRRAVLNICEQKYFGQASNIRTITAMIEKAGALENLNKYDDALKIFYKIVDLYTKRYGESGYKHDDTIKARENVARLLEKIGDIDAAVKEREKIFTLLKEKYPAEHEKVCSAMEKVAELFERQGKFNDALKWRRDIVKVSKDFVKPNCELANILDKSELYDDAQIVRENIIIKLKTQLDEYIKIYGENSNKIIKTLEDFALVNEKIFLKEGTHAYDIIVKILQDFKNSTSEKVLIVMSGIADTFDYKPEDIGLTYQKRLAQIQRKILNFRLKQWGNEHVRTLEIHERLANTLDKIGRGRVKESIDLRKDNLKALENIINRRIEKFSEDHEITLEAMRDCAAYLEKLERYEDAEDILKHILEIYEEKFSEDETNSKIIETLEKLASLMESNANFNGAVFIRNRIVNLLKKKYFNHETCAYIVNALKNLAKLHERRKDFYAAIVVQSNVVKLLERRYLCYENHQTLLNAKSELATLREIKPKDPSANLLKGQKVNLSISNMKLSKIAVLFRWDAENNFEIEHSAYLLGKNGKVHFAEDVISKNNPVNKSESVKYVESPAQINIDLEKIPTDVAKIDFTLTIADADKNFSQVKSIYLVVIDAQINEEILRFNLQQNLNQETAIIAGEIYRYKDDWKFNATGAGFIGGIDALNKNFGLNNS